ncbi:transcriptional regulator with XRE-family HTH domain [Sporomusaceae bacterium BoRhaA]|uniref:helix-turn-helix transcriptional regulator n=1 Tax=Pelorhabdus rhamnosifermentans TaxID=2772457 RepID=UPI001FE638F4|nr:helix-turn-helix transcriptional regulator [Pelorhabdus rhamnosifermentans]MBU2703780.1 transcriptional regulator with XRE-family HTH domain [Pelorhabdus rhamnosifermentans]
MGDRQKIKFAQIIKKIRASKKISQTELSKKTGFPQTTISDWENDKYLPDVMEAQKLAAVLGVTLSDLLNEKFSFPKHKAS